MIVLLVSSETYSATLDVPSVLYPTIQSAIDAGSNGDTIILDDGTYTTGNLSFGAKALTLTSASGLPSACIIQGAAVATTPTFNISPTDKLGSIIKNITIIGTRGTSNTSANGGAFNIQTSITLENCIIRNSTAYRGGGLHISNASKPVFNTCVFRSNAAWRGGVVYSESDASPTFKNCLFTGNDASNSGDVMYLDSNPANLVNCTLTNNSSNNNLIFQEASNLPMTILNCIINAASTSDFAVNGTDSGLGTTPYPSIVNTYIRGTYDYLRGGVSMVYEPTRILVKRDPYVNLFNNPAAVYVDYTGYLPPPATTFELNFTETTNFHLGMDSSCLGLGVNGSGFDYEDEERPYYLGRAPDLGADQFNYCYLVNNRPDLEGNHWFDVSLGSAQQQISTVQATGTWLQTGKVRFYRIIPSVSGVMRLWSDNASVDLKASLADGCQRADILVTADDDGNDFHCDYVYAQQDVPYYLAVTNKGTGAGSFNLFGEIQTDDRPNSCAIADTLSPGDDITITNTYFDGSYADQEIFSNIDFDDDEDCYKMVFSVPGTLMITSKFQVNGDVYGQTEPDYLEVLLKDSDCQVVAENTASGSFLIIHPNPSASVCYLNVDRNRFEESGAILNYGFDIRYYPLDETEPMEIILSGDTGSRSGAITIPGDRDKYFFDIVSPGTISAETSGCVAGENAKIDIYNSLNEKIVDNGASQMPVSGNYVITAAMVSETDEAPFFVSPGRYYLRVSALNSHTTPFEYDVSLSFTAVSDDHANYRQLATLLSPWQIVSSTDARLYFYPRVGHVGPMIGSDPETDYFRVDVPYNGTLDIMADYAASTGQIQARLLDYYGNPLATGSDIRVANPDFPMGPDNIPLWLNTASYLVNAMVQSPAGTYYKCIQAALGDSQSPANNAYWENVPAPSSVDGRIRKKMSPGIYYIEVTAAENLDYLISVDFDDFGDNWNEPEPPKLDSAFNSIIGHLETAANPAFQYSNDADAFELVVTEPNRFIIYTTGTSDTYGVIKYKSVSGFTPGDTVGGIQFATLYLEADYDFNKNFKILDKAETASAGSDVGVLLTPGTYSVELALTVPNELSPKTGDYVLHFEQVDDHCNHTVCPGNNPPLGIMAGDTGSQSGVIESPGDVDYYTFTPSVSGRLTVNVGDSSLSLILNLMDQDDNRLTYSSSGTLEFDVTGFQNYYLSVKPEFTLNTGDYDFDYSMGTTVGRDDDGALDSTGNDFADARVLAIGANPPSSTSHLTGGVDLAGDYDYYTFTVNGPGILKIYSTGTTDTYGYLFLETGNMFNLVMSNDDSDYDRTDGYNFGFMYYVEDSASRTFYVKVRGYSPQETGDYELHIDYTTGSDDHGDECGMGTLVNRNAPGSVWDGDSITFDESSIGFVDSNIGISGDCDYFKFVTGPEGTDKGSLTIYTSDGNEPVDTFGYLKNYMCGTIAMNDNGSGVGDGLNFRIAYTPNCVFGAASDCTPNLDCECIPHTYSAVVRSYDGVETGTYDLHIESNGVFVLPESTTRMDITGNGTRYFGFEVPGHESYLTANVTGIAPFNVGDLTATLYTGEGLVVPLQVSDFPIYVDGLSRGVHYLRIDNTNGSSAGEFDLALTCTQTGAIAYGNGDGTFSSNDGTLSITARGSDFGGGANTPDNGYFVYHKIEEGFEFIAKVRFTGGVVVQNSKAGLMVREDIRNAYARNVFSSLMRYNTATSFRARTQYRSTPNGATTVGSEVSVGDVSASGCYVRIHYDSDSNQVLTGYSTDGLNWSADFALAITLTPPLYVGYAVSSYSSSQYSQVEFTNVQYVKLMAEDE